MPWHDYVVSIIQFIPNLNAVSCTLCCSNFVKIVFSERELQYFTKFTWPWNDDVIIIFQSSLYWIGALNLTVSKYSDRSSWQHRSTAFLKSCDLKIMASSVSFILVWILLFSYYSNVQISQIKPMLKGSFLLLKEKHFSKITWFYINVVIISLQIILKQTGVS